MELSLTSQNALLIIVDAFKNQECVLSKSSSAGKVNCAHTNFLRLTASSYWALPAMVKTTGV